MDSSLGEQLRISANLNHAEHVASSPSAGRPFHSGNGRAERDADFVGKVLLVQGGLIFFIFIALATNQLFVNIYFSSQAIPTRDCNDI